MLKRILLFALVNVGVVVTISIVLSLLGVNGYLTARGLNIGNLAVFCLVWGMVGSFISLLLSRFMAKMLMGVQVIDPQRAHGTERELLELVHRLATQAGLSTMPEVGIYESPDLNAFATGPAKSRSLVAVSSGLLYRMNSSEIEGVLAHEISHITNGDMVTMTLIQGVVNAFVMFFARILSYVITQTLDEDKRPIAQFFITMVFEMILGVFGVMVVAWFSRHREFRADAGGARLAGRNKMVSALESLRRSVEIPEEEIPNTVRAFMISGGRKSFLELFSTHPPLEQRIERLRTQPLI